MKRAALFSILITGCFNPPPLILPNKTIHISLFTNKTAEYGLSEKLTKATVYQIEREERVKVAKREDAEVIVEGDILSYERVPIAWDIEYGVTEYRLSIRIEVRLILKEEVLKREMEESISYSGIDHSKGEREARDRLIIRLSERVADWVLYRR